jgi:TonB-linked SusC/RagA family outer membrane protein
MQTALCNHMRHAWTQQKKLFIVMKLITIFLVSANMAVSAKGFSQKKITLSLKDVPVQTVFREVIRQTGFSILYNEQLFEEMKPVSINVKDATIDEVMDKCLSGKSLTYALEGNKITINKSPSKTIVLKDLSPAIDVKGRLMNEKGEPLAGITVTVKGTQTATASNDNGFFELKGVAENATLLFTGVNIETYEMRVSGRTDLATLNLKSRIDPLEEVNVTVNTGYQRIAKERSAGSFSKPNLKVMADRSTSTSVLARLEGLVPGLSSASGGQSGGMVIRGSTTLGTVNGVAVTQSTPLLVVDGIQQSNADVNRINMQDVEDITVLKDATAASIWGARAANGVIVITTKKGRARDKIRIDYDGYYSFRGRPKRDYLPVLNTPEFINTEREIFALDAAATTYTAANVNGLMPHRQVLWDQQRGVLSAAQAQFKLDSLSTLDNWDQIDDIFIQDASQYNQTISISGGGNTHSFYGSFNHIGTKSNIPENDNNQYKINLRNDFAVGKGFQAYVIADITNAITRNIGGVNSGAPRYQLYQDANGAPSIINYIAPWGTATRPNSTQLLDFQTRSRINLDYSPVLERNREYLTGNNLSARFVGGATIDILKGLKFVGTYGYNVTNNITKAVLDESNWVVRRDLMRYTVAATPTATPVYNLPRFGGRLNSGNSQNRGWTIRNLLSYNLDWKKNQISVIAGQEATHTQGDSSSAVYYGWDDQLQVSRPVDFARLGQSLNGVAGPTGALPYNLGGGEGPIARTTSYYANGSYTYARKYTLNSSWRIDQSNLFGLDKSAQNRPVYSFGAKWTLSNEDFMKPLTWLNRLDIRLSYGITGNAPNVGIAASYDILRSVTDPNAVTGAGIVLAVPANDKLTWERTQVYNAGVDFMVLKGRLGASIDFYTKKTTDLIGTLFTSPLSGYASVTGNYGDLQNKGIDLLLNSVNLRNKNFLWSTTLVLGYNQNKITKLNNSAPTTGSEMVGTTILVGRPMFLLFAYDYAGLNSEGNPQARRTDKSLTASPNVTLPEDILLMGLTQAPWNGGLTNTFQYKDFSLGVNIVYSLGYKMRDPLNGLRNPLEQVSSINAEFQDRWKVPGDETRTDIPKYIALASQNALRFTGYYTNANTRILNASYAKIRDITLGYSSKLLARKINAQAIDFRLQVNNLLIWTANDKFYDPENGISRSRAPQGTITLGAHITL